MKSYKSETDKIEPFEMKIEIQKTFRFFKLFQCTSPEWTGSWKQALPSNGEKEKVRWSRDRYKLIKVCAMFSSVLNLCIVIYVADLLRINWNNVSWDMSIHPNVTIIQ